MPVLAAVVGSHLAAFLAHSAPA